jgi:hypothetical protein
LSSTDCWPGCGSDVHWPARTVILTAKDFAVSAILDSDALGIYLTSALADEIASDMAATLHEGTPYVPCSLHGVTDSLEFGFGGPEGLKIPVPYLR